MKEKSVFLKILSVLGWILFLIPILFYTFAKALLAGFGYKK